MLTCLRFSRPLICFSRNLWYSFSSIKKLEIIHSSFLVDIKFKFIVNKSTKNYFLIVTHPMRNNLKLYIWTIYFYIYFILKDCCIWLWLKAELSKSILDLLESYVLLEVFIVKALCEIFCSTLKYTKTNAEIPRTFKNVYINSNWKDLVRKQWWNFILRPFGPRTSWDHIQRREA